MVFTHLAITPPKVNRFRRDLEQCEPNVGVGRDRFIQKNAKIAHKNFQVLRLQAVITLQ